MVYIAPGISHAAMAPVAQVKANSDGKQGHILQRVFTCNTEKTITIQFCSLNLDFIQIQSNHLVVISFYSMDQGKCKLLLNLFLNHHQ